MFRRGDLPWIRPRRMNSGVERAHRAAQPVDRERGRDPPRGPGVRLGNGQRRHRGRWLRAVDERQPFLGAQRDRRAPAASASRPPARVIESPTQAWPSPMRTSDRWASGARSPLAPTEPRLGTRGWTRWLRKSSSRSSVARRMPEKPLARTFARSAIEARTARIGKGSPTPAAWLRAGGSPAARRASHARWLIPRARRIRY